MKPAMVLHDFNFEYPIYDFLDIYQEQFLTSIKNHTVADDDFYNKNHEKDK